MLELNAPIMHATWVRGDPTLKCTKGCTVVKDIAAMPSQSAQIPAQSNAGVVCTTTLHQRTLVAPRFSTSVKRQVSVKAKPHLLKGI